MSCGSAKGWPALCVGASVILIVWTLVLPWIGSWKSVQSQIEYLDRNGIDPTALYYTDLEAMERLESNVAAVSQAHPDAFWSISSAPRE